MAALRRAAGERPITTLLGFGWTPSTESSLAISRSSLRTGDGRRELLLGEFDRVDCGVETEIEIECPECFGVTRVELPFEKGFFLPSMKRKEAGSQHLFRP